MTKRVPNEALRLLREAMPSKASPGEVMSRQELAEQVAAFVWDRYRQEVPIDGKYVGKLERGYIALPRTQVYREALREVLGVATDRELGFGREPLRAEGATTGAVDRRSMIRGAASLGGAMVAAPGAVLASLLRDIPPAPVPATVGRQDIADVRKAAESFDRLDLAHGGGMVRAAATAQARLSARLLDTRCPDALRPDLFSAVGYLAHVCGMMAFDDGVPADARRLFEFALSCAEEADDWHLRAEALLDLARVGLWSGDYDMTLTYNEHAFVRSDRLTATERAGMWTQRAGALAGAGRRAEALAAIRRADREFARSSPGEAPPWFGYYTEAQHTCATGNSFYRLALLGHGDDRDEALRRYRAGVAGRSPAARTTAFTQSRMAILDMSGGDVDAAVAAGTAAVDATGPIRSRRLTALLGELHSVARQHDARPDVSELCQRLSPLLAA